MSHKDYNIAIVELLLQKPNHIRGIAKLLNTNQTTVSRKVKELYDQNIADYNFEGKNKVLFLKKTFEAKQYICIVELHKTMEIVEKYTRLRSVFERIKQNPEIKLAILFGSYAKGLAHKDSDIDLYIETTNRRLKEDIQLIDTKLSIKIGEYDSNNLLIKEIEKNHVIIKGVEEFYEKNKFFA